MAVVRELGAVAGWASAVLLAVLSAVYVAHAREVKRLREWAGAAPERGVTAVRRRAPRRIGTRFAAVALVGVAAYGVAQLANGGEKSGKRLPSKPKHAAAFKRDRVAVAVLNGTMVQGLAARLRDRLADDGFKKGAIDDYSDKRLAESVVEYAPGHEAEAKAVSRTLGIGRREPVTAAGRALAPGATVIVIAGADSYR